MGPFRAFPGVKALATISALLLAASAASAQPAIQPALPRADVQAAVGWQNLRSDPAGTSNNWVNSIAFADAAAGWYWTEHLRTQVDVGIGSTGKTYRTVEISSGSRPVYRFVRTDVRPATFAISQQYQFFHNAIFHPHVGGGVLVRSERLHDDYVDYDFVTPGTPDPGHTEDRTRTRVAALADVGFKAYMSERAFFSSDARFTIRKSVDGVLFRFGFGIDF